ncbi:MAG: chemotaxis protein CheW [Acaryochloris sp. RU_4_1]|nr:chemotaxis protein CheW [Acaryochloris sp. RU_4_1]NJR53547.1 chemotaxis protein CheW [Acaryochloris sp. CRU_2_0]
MSVITTAAFTVSDSTSKQERYILTQVGSWVLVFPSRWVAEIFRVERSQILDLPAYPSPLIGVIHHNSQILPLVSTHQILQTEETNRRETAVIIHLTHPASTLSNVGLVIDKALGSASHDQLPAPLFATSALHPEGTSGMVLCQPDWFTPDLWHPQA